ncbi:MAG: hypothetical protein ACXVLT_04090 [Flavisolibacter sp.]
MIDGRDERREFDALLLVSKTALLFIPAKGLTCTRQVGGINACGAYDKKILYEPYEHKNGVVNFHCLGIRLQSGMVD